MQDYKDLLLLYKNYLIALQERQIYGDKYGDTNEIIQWYEEELKTINLLKQK